MGKEEEGEGGEGIHEGNCVWNRNMGSGCRRRVAERNAPKTKEDSLKSKGEPSSEKPVWSGTIDSSCSRLSIVCHIFGRAVVDLVPPANISM